MYEHLRTMVIYCGSLFAGSFLSGIFPLWVSSLTKHTRLITVYGAGLMLGVALGVIIPEGVKAVEKAKLKHELVGVYLAIGFMIMVTFEQMMAYIHECRKPSYLLVLHV